MENVDRARLNGWQKINMTRGAERNRKEKEGEKKDIRDAHSTGEKENVRQRNARQPLKRRMVKVEATTWRMGEETISENALMHMITRTSGME